MDIDFKDFKNLYKKRYCKPSFFLVVEATLASDNPSCFRQNLLERTRKLIKTNDDKIRVEKLEYDINKEAAKISTISSGKIDINMNTSQMKKHYLPIEK